jgi:hypothetical protein
MIEYMVAEQPVGEFAGCAEWDRLLRRFIAATGDLIVIQAQTPGTSGPDNSSFDRMLQDAAVERLRAKWALLRHLKRHRRCGLPEWVAAEAAAKAYTLQGNL